MCPGGSISILSPHKYVNQILASDYIWVHAWDYQFSTTSYHIQNVMENKGKSKSFFYEIKELYFYEYVHTLLR